MLHKVTLSQKFGNSHIAILYPGKVIGHSDSGIGSIGRIDQANIHSGTTIKMHPHSNDEILSYFRTGNVVHTDSSGATARISRKKLMLMKAGKVFYHEEKILDHLEGLQIFIRPMMADVEPEVVFYDLPFPDSFNTWRHLASFQSVTPLHFTSATDIFDLTITDNALYQLPKSDLANQLHILYVFQGSLLANHNIALTKGESLIFENEPVVFSSAEGAEVVLFVTDKAQNCFKEGMYSGNQL